MAETIDDEKAFTIQIEAMGELTISNVVAPETVGLNEPFEISYDCINNGMPRELWGAIINSETGWPMSNTYWIEHVETIQNILNQFDGIIKDLLLTIKVGIAP